MESTDERFDDLRHLNRAGAGGWQAYDRAPMYVINAASPVRRHILIAPSPVVGPHGVADPEPTFVQSWIDGGLIDGKV
jgi:hypothetical protein